MANLKKHRAGSWLPHNASHIEAWIKEFKIEILKQGKPLIKPIQEFKEMVESDAMLNATAAAMFTEARIMREKTPLGTPEVKDFDEFLVLLNGIMTMAPQFTECPDKKGDDKPCGLIGFPINALLDWPMGTSYGYDFFANSLVNQQFKKILDYWSEYLVSKDSRSVLIENHPERTPKVIAWLSETSKKYMVQVACEATGEKVGDKKFEDIFKCDPSKKYYGFKSWDDFFIREFKKGVRPIAKGKDVIANACESAPLRIQRGVQKDAKFWLKEQPYSLENMMNFDPLSEEFVDKHDPSSIRFKGATVYQAFLSALSYHRWNAPVDGKIKKAFIVNGTYYLENKYKGFVSKKPDPVAPNDSQEFLSAVATRAVIFIEADNPKIGLMCFIAIGMAEVSSCEITVKQGQKIQKGEELGMFHFGGSTHCLIFRPGVDLEFDLHENKKPSLDAINIPVHSKIATVR